MSANRPPRVRHANRKRSSYKLTRQRNMLPLLLLAMLGAVGVHVVGMRVAPALYKLWEKHFGDPNTPEKVENDEVTRVVVHKIIEEEQVEAQVEEPPPPPEEPEELEVDPTEIDLLDVDLPELIMAPGETNIPLPEPEVDMPQNSPDAQESLPTTALDPTIIGTSELPDQDEHIPEPTPLNSNSVIANASPQSEALENADGLIESEMRRQAREGEGGLGSDVRSLAELMGVRNPGANTGVARLKTDVLFGFNQSKLKNEARIPLLQLAALIHKNPKTRFIIEGHTDSIGSDEYNALLSLQRAAAVCHWLAGNGVPMKNVYMRACGCTRPLDDVTAPRDKQKNNRRVEIHMRRPEEALPPDCLPSSYEVDRDTPVQTQLRRGIRAPFVNER